MRDGTLKQRPVGHTGQGTLRLKTPRDFRAPPQIPSLFVALCAGWEFSPTHKDTLWDAARTSTSPKVQSWRQQILFENGGPLWPPGYLPPSCTPAAVVYVIELLVEEAVLTRGAAAAMEDLLLAAVDRQGQWQEPRETPAP
jgi:hypothetical protein